MFQSSFGMRGKFLKLTGGSYNGKGIKEYRSRKFGFLVVRTRSFVSLTIGTSKECFFQDQMLWHVRGFLLSLKRFKNLNRLVALFYLKLLFKQVQLFLFGQLQMDFEFESCPSPLPQRGFAGHPRGNKIPTTLACISLLLQRKRKGRSLAFMGMLKDPAISLSICRILRLK